MRPVPRLCCGQSLATNVLKHLMDQLEERILQNDQLKNMLTRTPSETLALIYIVHLIRILNSNFLLNYFNFGDTCKHIHEM